MNVTGAESRTGAPTAGQGFLPAVATLVLALVLAFVGPALADPSPHTGMHPAAAERTEADPVAGTPCHRASRHGGSVAGADTDASGHAHHGDHHDPGGCCAIALCGGACAGVCSGVGVSAASSDALLHGVHGVLEIALRTVDDPVPAGTPEAPFRPPIVAPSASGG